MKPPKRPTPSTLHKMSNGKVFVIGGDEPEPSSESENLYFQNYSEYSKTLRAWLVAYGVGGPILFLTNQFLLTTLKTYPHKNFIINLFLIGVAMQVFLAFINKWCAWQMYAGECEKNRRDSKTYKFWAWLNESSWIDLMIDGLSLVAFAVSTVMAIKAFS